MNIKELLPLTKELAEQALREISLLSVHAYADAALHGISAVDMNDGRISVDEAHDRVIAKFKDTDLEVLINESFKAIEDIVTIRSIASPKPGEIDYELTGKIKAISAQREQLQTAVEDNTLPYECLKAFDKAFSIATIRQPKPQWVEAATARRNLAEAYR